MIDKNLDNMEISKIDKIIESQYYKSGIAGFLQKNSPEMFIILIRQVIPKHRQLLECQEKVKSKEKQVEKLEVKLTEAEKKLKSCSAKLRFWEREEKISIRIGKFRFPSCNYWLLLNTIFDWTLKAGLTIVPILSLLSIAGIRLSNLFDPDKQPFLGYTLFSSVSLVWLTSATISSWVISHPNSDPPKVYSLLKGSIHKWNFELAISPNTLTLFILFGIWLAEALIGFALIPGLIDSQRAAINRTLEAAKKLQLLTDLEKFEILLGVSIFAFINILFSVAKGRMYRFSTPSKQEYGAALADRNRLLHVINKEEEQINKLKEKIESLEKEVINPIHFQGEDYFNKAINDLSTFSMQGQDIKPTFDLLDFHGISLECITDEYNQNLDKIPDEDSDIY